MWSVQSQYAKGTLFQWQFERYNHYNAKNYFDLSGYSSTNGMHLQPSLKPNGDPYTDKLGRPLPNSTIKIFVKNCTCIKGMENTKECSFMENYSVHQEVVQR